MEHGRDAVGDEHGGAEDARDRDVPDHVLGGHRDEPNSPEDESQEHSRSGSFPPARDDGFLVPISGPTEEALCPNSGGFGAQSFGVTLRNGERGAVILKENSGTISLVLRWREGGHYRSRAIACFGHVRPSLHRPEILLGDGRVRSKEIPSDSVHLVVTSPPYYSVNEGTWENLTEYLAVLDSVFRECFRVLDCGRWLCVNTMDQYGSTDDYGRFRVVPSAVKTVAGIIDAGFYYMGEIVWRKIATQRGSGGGRILGGNRPPNMLYGFNHERIALFRKPGSPKRTPTEEEYAASRLPSSLRSARDDDLWVIQGERRDLHPAPFPLELPLRLILRHSVVGDTVLDPFAGSGTTMLAAARLARKSIGIEVRADHVETIHQRLKAMGRLFGDHSP